MSEMPDFKECPFCGNDSHNLDYGVRLSYPNDLYYVRCSECGIEAVMEHIEAWNRRAERREE